MSLEIITSAEILEQLDAAHLAGDANDKVMWHDELKPILVNILSLVDTIGAGAGGDALQELTDAATITWDLAAGRYAKVEISANRNISVQGLSTPCSGILIVKHLVAGTQITLPGVKAENFAWVAGANNETVLGFVHENGFFRWSSDGYSLTGTPTLAAPTGFTVTPGDASNTIQWGVVANADTYTLQRSTDNVNWTTVYSGAYVASFVNSGLTNGTLYYYRVNASAAGYVTSGYATGNGTPAAAGGGGSYDADAVLFFTSAGISDNTQKSAWDGFVVETKAAGVWPKIKTVYPFIGGNATAHKFNAKNPVDSDAGFRIEFGGTVSHSANGIIGNGVDGYADTKFVPNDHFADKNSISHFGYNRSNIDGRLVNGYASGAGIMQIVPRLSGSGSFAASCNQSSGVTVANADARGCYIVSRTDGSTLKAFRNGVQIGTTETTLNVATALLTQPISLLCEMANTGRSSFSALNVAMYGVAEGLSDSEVTALNTAILNFQTALGRNV